MHKIETLRAGDFIDLDNYYRDIECIVGKELTDDENVYYSTVIEKFFVLLGLELPKTEKEYTNAFTEYSLQVVKLKNDYEFIYNPPPSPSTTDIKESTIGDEYRKEFAEMYGAYTEITYLISALFHKFPKEVLEMNVLEWMFWGNYLLHKRWVENIK